MGVPAMIRNQGKAALDYVSEMCGSAKLKKSNQYGGIMKRVRKDVTDLRP
jgi:hypothetical protein